ncbi:MAG: hypothetical protein E6423_00675 [Clostridium sp.]|nr:hypothetical protein [Clostridium sp.]
MKKLGIEQFKQEVKSLKKEMSRIKEKNEILHQRWQCSKDMSIFTTRN